MVSQLSLGLAATEAIGIAMADGSIQLNEALVSGNGTLFEGTTVTTGQAASQLRLNGGVTMDLASDSRGTVYQDRILLLRGAGQLESARGYRIEAKGLNIVSDSPESAARVWLKEGNLVQVAALRGQFRVTNRDGIVLAAMPAGRALAFSAPQAGASAPSAVSGCLAEKDGHYFLTDETAEVTFELRGDGLDVLAGRKVAVTGVIVPKAEPAKGAAQVLQVSSLKQLSERCSSVAGAAAAGGAAAGAAAAGAAAGGAAAVGATTAVVAGVAVAAAGTAAAVGLTRGEEEETTISR